MYRSGQSLGPRVLTDYELVLIVDGSITYTADSKAYQLSPGDVVLGTPGTKETYLWDRNNPTRHEYVHFHVEHWPEDWPHIDTWQNVFHEPDSAIIPLFRHMLKHLSDHDDWPAAAPGRSEARLVETMLDILLRPHHDRETGFQRDKLPEPVVNALTLMKLGLETIPATNYALQELANASGKSDKHLCRLFTDSLGISPIKTYNLIRLHFAIALLTRSNMNISEIAERCGYKSNYYFSRSFHKAFGKAPTEMRRDLLAGTKLPPNPLPSVHMPRMYW